MGDARTRAEQELNELGEKISKLVKFLYSTKVEETNITVYMLNLMHDQLRAMQDYAGALRERLRIWDMSEEEIYKTTNEEIYKTTNEACHY